MVEADVGTVATIRAVDGPKGSYDNPFKRKDAETLNRALRIINHDFRWNVRAKHVEYRQAVVPGDPTPWEHASDRVVADVREIIERQFWVRT